MFRVLRSSGINATTRIQTRQTHSSANPVETVKVALQNLPIDVDLKPKINELYNKNNEKIEQWVASEVVLAHGDMSASNPHSRAAAEGFNLISTLTATSRFLEQYDVFNPYTPILHSIKHDHRAELNTKFKTAFDNLAERKLQVMLCVEPGVLEEMGITNFPISQKELARSRQDIPAKLLLTESEFLATVAYLNSQTELFAALNGAGRSKAYYGTPLFADIMREVSKELKSGLEKLSFHPLFKRTDIPVYKGIMTSDAAGLFRLATLEEKIANRGLITFPHTMSGTEEITRSYCHTKGLETYNVLLAIKIKRGAAVDPLHDKHTVGEQEVVVPEGMRCRVIRRYEEFIKDPNVGSDVPVTTYELEEF